MATRIPSCCLCRGEAEYVRLVRMCWEIDERDPADRPRLAVMREKLNGCRFLCEDCIRGIKRLPFSELQWREKTNDQ